ncbi:MAG: VWA domain-containing protein [Planctomycetota bacterium]
MPAASQRTFIEIQPVLRLIAPWQWLLFGLIATAFILFVLWMNRRDTVHRAGGLRFLLTTLRLSALAGIVLFVLNPVLKSESRIEKSSRIVVLIDTSLSMGLSDFTPDAQSLIASDSESREARRIDEVIAGLSNEGSLTGLNASHAIDVYNFGDESRPELFASVPIPAASNSANQNVPSNDPDSLSGSETYAWIAVALLAVSIFTALIWLSLALKNRGREIKSASPSWFMAASLLLIVSSVALLAVCDLTSPEHPLSESAGWRTTVSGTVDEAAEPLPARQETNGDDSGHKDLIEVDWSTAVTPRGTSTRLGSAIEYIVNKERGGPIAAIVVFTDGRSNAGTEPARAVASASNAGIPVFPIGIGSTDAPRNVAIADIQAPPRVYPGDKFKIKGLVKSSGLAGQTIRIRLLSAIDDEDSAIVEDEISLNLADSNEALPVEFEVAALDEGKKTFSIRAMEVEGDLDPKDNLRSATVEIIERKTVVLLMAGGPTREFRFLRNQLFRDRDVTLNVWLQTAKEGADQEADELLFEFPATREAMFEYDCIIAFDPDWRELNEIQATLLERWVAEKAGGILVVAGPVYTPEWTRTPRGDKAIDIVRQLYPVSFYSQGSAQLKLGRFGGEQPYPLDFTREGRAAEYLWLGDSAADSAANWNRFEGVFGYYAVNEPKPGADILAEFADPATSVDDRLPIYLASHYYGAGRVFFQASGEMWRVRRVDTEFFNEYYLKLLRWVSQGRLLRDSNRGVLIADRNRCWMGDQVGIQAIVRDARDEPLDASSLTATITRPDDTSVDLELTPLPDAVRPGTFSATFPTTLEGEYLIQLPLPDSNSGEVLQAIVEAGIPDLEKEQPQRNDPLLQRLADRTNGYYYTGINQWNTTAEDPVSPLNLIATQNQQIILPGTPSRTFTEKLMTWLLILIVVCLSIEWTIRRLHRLA